MDFSTKSIAFRNGEKQYLISFRWSRLKGIHRIKICEKLEGSKSFYYEGNAVLEDATPDIRGRIVRMKELFCWEIHNIMRRLKLSHQQQDKKG